MTTQIDKSQIEGVYSGIDGRCCCGCAGKHTYASAFQKAAGKRRGYKVDDCEVSDRTVALIVNKINAAPAESREYHDGNYRKFHTAVIGGRLYIAYLVEQPKKRKK